MRVDLKRRVTALEAGHTGPILQGWTLLDDTEALYGVGTFYDEPDPELTRWLKTFTPKLEKTCVMLLTEPYTPGRTHKHTVPAGELQPEVKELLTPYLSPGASLHMLDRQKEYLDG